MVTLARRQTVAAVGALVEDLCATQTGADIAKNDLLLLVLAMFASYPAYEAAFPSAAAGGAAPAATRAPWGRGTELFS